MHSATQHGSRRRVGKIFCPPPWARSRQPAAGTASERQAPFSPRWAGRVGPTRGPGRSPWRRNRALSKFSDDKLPSTARQRAPGARPGVVCAQRRGTMREAFCPARALDESETGAALWRRRFLIARRRLFQNGRPSVSDGQVDCKEDFVAFTRV